MREIKGWVCLVKLFGEVGRGFTQHILFGPANDISGVCDNEYANLTINDLATFSTEAEAKEKAILLRQRRDFRSVSLRYFTLRIAETENDLTELKKSQNLIVIGYGEFSNIFLGRHVEGAPHIGHIPGSILFANGFRGAKFNSATYICQELRRQGGGMKTQIAAFTLKTRP